MTPTQRPDDRLADGLAQHAQRPLFACDDGQQYAYADVLDLGARAAFRATRRRLVFCLCDNAPAALIGYLALLQADAVPLLLSANLPTPQLQRLLTAYQPAYVWLAQERLGELPQADRIHSQGGYALVAKRNVPVYALHEDLALLLSTSGSTGSPKFVRLSHHNVRHNAEAIAQYLDIGPDDRPITTLPPSYTYGLSILHSHLVKGCTLALTNRTFIDRAFWGFFESVQATSMGGVPYHYELLQKLRFERMALPSLRTLTQAGGRMDPAQSRTLAEHCAARGIRFFTMYGQVEATARIAYLSPQWAVGKAGSIGRAIPGGELWLSDAAGTRQDAPGAIGQLVYRGPNVCMGYAQGYHDLARGDEMGGTIHTGDLACRDADGDYIIVGRIKRFIKLFGHSIHLQDIEDELAAAGHMVACAGADDQLDIYLESTNAAAAAPIKAQLVAQFKISPAAIRVWGIAAIPRLESGKIQYAELAALQGAALA